jgi:divalent metal cation (Fe/Co/Zn/Cd) transporter
VNRKVYWLQGVTIAWMVAECTAALYSAIETHSVSILAFGSDSLIELLSALVALVSFIPQFHISEERTARWSGVLLILLCIVVVSDAVLSLLRRREAVESWSGIIVTALALVVMPILAWWKRSIARQTGNRALAADAVQSATCAYLAAITLCSLVVSALFQIRWADPVAAFVAVPVIVYEARRALRGQSCGCGPDSELCSTPHRPER